MFIYENFSINNITMNRLKILINEQVMLNDCQFVIKLEIVLQKKKFSLEGKSSFIYKK